MLTIKSDKTSLMDLSINDLQNVAWEHIDVEEFIEDLKNPNFVARMMYGKNREVLSTFCEFDNFLTHAPEEFMVKMIEAKKTKNSHFKLSTMMFYDRKQYSIEFLTKYADHIEMYHVEHQSSITPEFLEKYHDSMDVNTFWERFNRTFGNDKLKDFAHYKNGMFLEEIQASDVIRYLTISDLQNLELPAPDYYNNVMTEQRVMSGEPCNDGQRSFSIWLRKYRRVSNNPTGFPTWNELLELYKKYPRMNQNGYVDWLHSRAVFKDEQTVDMYPEQLSYSPKEISFNAYIDEAGDDHKEEDYKIEFADVLEPEQHTVQVTVQITPDVEVARRMPARDPATGRFISSN